jgi:hypothetical protein
VTKYLLRDIIGAASGIVYGKKGDQIKVIRENYDMWLIENKGVRFSVWPKDLSEDPVEANEIIETDNIQQKTRKGKKTIHPSKNELFS